MSLGLRQRGRQGFVATLATLPLLVLLHATPAAAAQNFDQARAADIGVSENGTVRPTGYNQPGECIVSIQRWIAAAGGRMAGGGAYSAYANSPADLITTGSVAVVAQAVKGDVIQYTYNPNRDLYPSGVHTVMVVANNGNGTLRIVQSNANWDGKVTIADRWVPTPRANFTAYLWRFGQVTTDRDFTFIKTRNTGSGKVEVHTATAASGYKAADMHAASWFGTGDQNNGWFQMVGAKR